MFNKFVTDNWSSLFWRIEGGVPSGGPPLWHSYALKMAYEQWLSSSDNPFNERQMAVTKLSLNHVIRGWIKTKTRSYCWFWFYGWVLYIHPPSFSRNRKTLALSQLYLFLEKLGDNPSGGCNVHTSCYPDFLEMWQWKDDSRIYSSWRQLWFYGEIVWNIIHMVIWHNGIMAWLPLEWILYLNIAWSIEIPQGAGWTIGPEVAKWTMDPKVLD